jgi:hypothetical protein
VRSYKPQPLLPACTYTLACQQVQKARLTTHTNLLIPSNFTYRLFLIYYCCTYAFISFSFPLLEIERKVFGLETRHVHQIPTLLNKPLSCPILSRSFSNILSYRSQTVIYPGCLLDYDRVRLPDPSEGEVAALPLASDSRIQLPASCSHSHIT